MDFWRAIGVYTLGLEWIGIAPASFNKKAEQYSWRKFWKSNTTEFHVKAMHKNRMKQVWLIAKL